MKKTEINIDRLRADLRYCPDTGRLFWTHQRNRNPRCGLEAGHIGNMGYCKVKYKQNCWLAHVLAWMIVNGPVPECMEIDHINRDPSDNRLANLRLVTRSENMRNTRNVVSKNAPYGCTYNKREGKWKAGIRRNGKRMHFGTFVTCAEAAAAVARAINASLEQGARRACH